MHIFTYTYSQTHTHTHTHTQTHTHTHTHTHTRTHTHTHTHTLSLSFSHSHEFVTSQARAQVARVAAKISPSTRLQRSGCLDERGCVLPPAGIEPRLLRWLSKLSSHWATTELLARRAEISFLKASWHCTKRVVEQCSFGLHKRVAASRRCSWYRSHFGSRYTLGSCSHAGLFVRAFGLAFSI